MGAVKRSTNRKGNSMGMKGSAKGKEIHESE